MPHHVNRSARQVRYLARHLPNLSIYLFIYLSIYLSNLT